MSPAARSERRVTIPGTWDRDRIVRAIHEWHEVTGAPPRSYDWSPSTGRAVGLVGVGITRWEREHPRWPERQTVRGHFGSWRAALIAAGFPAPPPLRGSSAKRIEVARRLADAGESLTAIADHLGVHVNSVRNYLKATRCPRCRRYQVSARASMCLACFLEARNRPAFDEDQVIDAIRSWVGETGRIPTMPEWTPATACAKWDREWPRWPSAHQIINLFGTWADATGQSGLPRSRERYTREHLIAVLRAETERAGRPPTNYEWKVRRRRPAASTFERRFGSWSQAIAAAAPELRSPPDARHAMS